MNPTATLFRDILARIGDKDNPATKMGMANFGLQTKYGDYAPLRAILKASPFCVEPKMKEMLLRQKQQSNQGVALDMWQRTPAAISNNLIQTGFVQSSTVRVPMVIDRLEAAKFTLSRSGVTKWDTVYQTARERLEAEMQFIMMDALRQIVDSMAVRAAAFLEANTSIAGGLGNVYNTVGNFKEIPSAENNFIRNLYIDSPIQNNWYVEDNAKHIMVGSSLLQAEVDDIRQFGTQNQRDAAPQIDYFDYFPSTKIAPDATYKVKGYAIDKAGVYHHTWVPNYGIKPDDQFYYDQEFITNGVVPVGLFKDVPPFEFAMFVSKNFADNFAIENFEESRLDQVFNLTVYTFNGFGKAQNTLVPNQQPITKFQKLI